MEDLQKSHRQKEVLQKEEAGAIRSACCAAPAPTDAPAAYANLPANSAKFGHPQSALTRNYHAPHAARCDAAKRCRSAATAFFNGNEALIYGNELLMSGNESLCNGNEELLSGNDWFFNGNQPLFNGNAAFCSGNDRLKNGNAPLIYGNESRFNGNQRLRNGNKRVLNSPERLFSSKEPRAIAERGGGNETGAMWNAH